MWQTVDKGEVGRNSNAIGKIKIIHMYINFSKK